MKNFVTLITAGLVGGMVLVGCGSSTPADEELNKAYKSLKAMNVEVGQIDTFVEKCYETDTEKFNKMIKKANALTESYGRNKLSAYSQVINTALDACPLVKGAEYTTKTADKSESLSTAITDYVILKFQQLERANSGGSNEKNPYSEDVSKTKAAAAKLSIETSKLESYANKCYSTAQKDLEAVAKTWHNNNIVSGVNGNSQAYNMQLRVKDMCALTDGADYLKKLSETNDTVATAARNYINAIILEKFYNNLVSGKLVANTEKKK